MKVCRNCKGGNVSGCHQDWWKPCDECGDPVCNTCEDHCELVECPVCGGTQEIEEEKPDIWDKADIAYEEKRDRDRDDKMDFGMPSGQFNESLEFEL